MSAAASIVVRAPNWTGDLVMSTPGFRALRAGHPEAHLALWVRPHLAPLLAGAPWFDAVYQDGERGVAAPLRAGLRLREERRFDLGICIPDSFSSAIALRAAGVREIVGYRRGGRSPLLHRALSLPAEAGPRRLVPRERFVLGLVEATGAPPRGTHLELFTTAAEEAAAEALLGPDDGAPRVALAPGASFGPSKCWPPESFAAVGDALAEAGARVLLLGAAAEAPRVERVRGAMRAPALDLAGATTLGVLKAVLRRCRLLVGNDAGARHVAVAFGVPAIVFFGPTTLEKTSLNLERVLPLETRHPCRPCYRRECPIDHRCLRDIDAGEVAALARDHLSVEPA